MLGGFILLFPSLSRVLCLKHIFQGTTQPPYLERRSGSLQQPEVNAGVCLFIMFEHYITLLSCLYSFSIRNGWTAWRREPSSHLTCTHLENEALQDSAYHSWMFNAGNTWSESIMWKEKIISFQSSYSQLIRISPFSLVSLILILKM